MDPWGTPQLRGAEEDENLPKLTEKLVFVKYDLIYLEESPWMPQH